MSHVQPVLGSRSVPPPTKHQLAFMIWVAVFPTLTVLNLLLGDLLSGVTRCCGPSCSPPSRYRS